MFLRACFKGAVKQVDVPVGQDDDGGRHTPETRTLSALSMKLRVGSSALSSHVNASEQE